MPIDPVPLPTVAEIARRLGCTLHQARYAIRTRRIRPSGRAGNVAVFCEDDVTQVRCERARIDRAARGVADGR